MASLYDKINPSAAPQAAPAAGTPGYEANIVNRATNRLRPQYNLAVKNARQSLSNRGMMRGGLVQEAEGRLGEGFRSDIADVASGAATHSADLGEAERVRQQMRGWQVEDIQRALTERRTEAQKAQDAADQAMWAGLVSDTVGSVTQGVGSSFGKRAAEKQKAYER